MSQKKYGIGIDIAKDTFKTCVALLDEQQKFTVKSTSTFANTSKGFVSFLDWVDKHCKPGFSVSLLMEATGVYYEALAWFLYGKDRPVSVILPTKAKYYFKSIGLKSKNDKIDAIGLARMAGEQHLPLWQPMSKSLYQLRSITRLLENLKAQKTACNNQLQALSQSMYPLKEACQSLVGVINHLTAQIHKLEKQVQQFIAQDPLLKSKYEKINPIKGIGLLTFAVIVGETNGFTLFENQRQLISYAGYDVIENQSGKRSGRTRISKKGNAHLRKALYFPALSAVNSKEPAPLNLYTRVYARTGIKMKAYVAVQKKLLCLFYTLWKKDIGYDPTYRSLLTINPTDRLLKEVASLMEATQDELP